MSVIPGTTISYENVDMEGVSKVKKANVIGPPEGWSYHTLRVFRLGPGGFTPRHRHDWEHVNFVIRGSGTLTLGGETFPITAGDYAFVPPNEEHQFKNPSDEDFEFICIVPSRRS